MYSSRMKRWRLGWLKRWQLSDVAADERARERRYRRGGRGRESESVGMKVRRSHGC